MSERLTCRNCPSLTKVNVCCLSGDRKVNSLDCTCTEFVEVRVLSYARPKVGGEDDGEQFRASLENGNVYTYSVVVYGIYTACIFANDHKTCCQGGTPSETLENSVSSLRCCDGLLVLRYLFCLPINTYPWDLIGCTCR